MSTTTAHRYRFPIPPQQGRTAIVTGANSGIGFQTAKVLAAHGAHVVLACRSAERAEEAARVIRDESPSASLEVASLDLSELASVRRFAQSIGARHPRIDLLVANAAVMMPPRRELTVDGFELQMGTNHLGHFALVGLLLDRLVAVERSRVVLVTSLSEHFRALDLGDLSSRQGRYGKYTAYSRSKLANLLFAFELARRLEARRSPPLVAAAHVGIASTKLQRHSPLTGVAFGLVGMRPEEAAGPVIYTAVAADVRAGGYYGPRWLGGLRGGDAPSPAWASRRARDAHVAARLWEQSVELTGVAFDALER